jgi:dynein heavy chain
LNDLQEFIKVTSSGLNAEVGEDDYQGLIGVMVHLLAIKDRQPTTDDMFEPLKQTIELLQSYDHTMPDEVHQQLEVYQIYMCSSSA